MLHVYGEIEKTKTRAEMILNGCTNRSDYRIFILT